MTATHTSRAWSCTVRLVVADDHVLTHAVQDLTALLDRVDLAASRFRPDSALAQANARAGRPTPIPKLLVRLLSAALDAADATGGAVDPTVGRTVRALGYDRDIADVSPDGPAVAALPPARDWRAVRLHREAGLLTVPAGTALDLGATAKAWTADHAARTLAARYDTAVLVELGGDLAVAGQPDGGWCVRVAEREGGDGELLLVHRGGVTTSTTTVRAWRRGCMPVHHIVDPRTGLPAAGPWRTVTVAAESALDANTASTAAIVLGDSALEWLSARGSAARLVHVDGSVHTTSGWPSARTAAAA
jgi:thiamine biosynthesis lipoprotein